MPHHLKYPLDTCVTLVLLMAVHGPLRGQQSKPVAVKVLDGTIVRVVLTENLSSGTSHQNDAIHFQVAENVKVGDAVVIAKGAPAIGHVSIAEPKGRWGHSGQLSYSLDYAKAVDGSNVRLRASSSQGGQDSKAALMLGLSGAFKHGKDIKVPEGSSMSAYVDGDHEITPPIAPPEGSKGKATN